MPAPSGTRNPAAKLNEEKVRYIREHHLTYVNTRELAEKFNVTPNTINAVTSGITWSWLK